MAVTASCITVNVNFPESAVQAAANDFVKDLYKEPQATVGTGAADAAKESDAVKSNVKKASKKKAAKVPATAPAPAATEPTTMLFDWLVTPAFAQELNTNTPKANEIRERMRARVEQIRAAKQKGAVCETSDALLVAKDPSMKALVKAENADRDALYEEIASTNHITDRGQTKIRRHFAAAFHEHSPPGTCFQE
jgi:uncharacterized protein YdbL (DUF1318 family)